MKRFIIFTTNFNGNTPIFNKKELNITQKSFVEKCAKQLGNADRPDTPNFAYVMYNGPEDFAAAAMPVKDTATAEQEARDLFNPPKYPQVGAVYDRDWVLNNGGEWGAMMFDMLAEGGIWPWENAKAVFKKIGNTVTVVETM